jgi:hypothetical protein
MAGKSASILVKIIGDESGFKKSLGGAGSELDSFSKKMDAQGQRMQGLGAKMTAGVTLPIVAFGAVAVKNFMEAEKAQAQLEASLKSTGATAWTSADQMDELASSMQDKYAVDGDLVKSGASLLLTFTKVKNAAGEGNDVFDRTTQTAIDMSRKLGMDLPAANMLLGKSLNDPIKGMGALRKAGVQLTAQQEAQVRAFVASGDILSAQKVILGELETQFAGSAAAYAETTEGQLEAAKLALEDVSEEIGARLVPVLTSMGDGLVTALEKWDGLSEGTQTFVLILAGVAAALGPVTTVVGTIMRAGTALSDMRGKLTQVTTTAEGSTTSLTRVGKAAAGLGAAGAAFAVYQMAQALNEATRDAVGLETAMNDLKAADGPKDVGKAIQDAAAASEGWVDKLRDIGSQLGGGSWDTGAIEVEGYRVELDNVDAVLKEIKSTGDDELLRGAIAAFREADTSGAQGIGTLDRFNATLDSYEENLRSSGDAAAATAEDEAVLAAATEETEASTADLSAEVQALTDQLRELQGGARDVDEAQRALLDSNAALVTSFAENGLTLDISTEAGRRNTDALVAQIDASFELAAKQSLVDTTGRTASATLVAQAGSLRDLRDRGIIPTDAEYQRLLTTYGLTPEQITTRIQADTADAKAKSSELTSKLLAMPGVPAPVVAHIRGLINSGSLWEAETEINRVARDRSLKIWVDAQFRPGSIGGMLFAPLAGGRAKGGPVAKGAPYLVGEEGPEIVVPDQAGQVMTAGETRSILAGGAGGRALTGSSSSPSVVVHLEGAVIAGRDAERWLVETIETAVARGIQMPKLKTALR